MHYLIRLYNWVMCRLFPLDWGEHGIIKIGDDGSFTPLDDDDMWDMMSEAAIAEDEWWEQTFVDAFRRYGPGVFAEN